MRHVLLSDTTPIARKPHSCIWCGEQILVGEKYRREKSVYDGFMQNHAWHLECDQACREENNSSEFEFSPGEYDRPKERIGFK